MKRVLLFTFFTLLLNSSFALAEPKKGALGAEGAGDSKPAEARGGNSAVMASLAALDSKKVGDKAEADSMLPNVLLEAAMRGEEKAKRSPSPSSPASLSALEGTDETTQSAKRRGNGTPGNLDEVLLSLVDEVEALKSKVVVVSRTERATQTPKERKSVGSRTVYNYKEGAIFEIHAGVDRVTDIELGAGEILTNPPVSGDTVRWKVSILESEKGGQKSTHIIVKPVEEDIETNLILTTNKNVYHLKLMASDWYMPAVSFNYPEDEARALEAMNQRKRAQEKVAVSPDKLNFSYNIEGRKYGWRPRQVFDDGEKTYIKMPQNLSTTEAPALFLLSRDDDPMLVNYRVKGDFYIVDRLFERAEMRVGKSERAEIISERDNRTFFERNF
jgi:P-type conjugative transfer protein TrbG